MPHSWYQRSLPKVRDVSPHLPKIAQLVKDIEGVVDVYLWGSLLKYADKLNQTIKDIDIVAKTNFFSEDLVSITNHDRSPLTMTEKELSEEGFDPQCVYFTKKFVSLKDYGIDHWAISSDNKMLHWGILADTKQSWEEMKNEAEEQTQLVTGYNSQKLPQNKKNNWLKTYNSYIDKSLTSSKVPNGWYLLEEDVDKILKEIKKIS